MTKIVIYSSQQCPYCVRAKELLSRKGLPYEELRVDLDPALRDRMIALTGLRSVPQIFIGDTHVGGCDDLHALERSGELDVLLRTKALA